MKYLCAFFCIILSNGVSFYKDKAEEFEILRWEKVVCSQ